MAKSFADWLFALIVTLTAMGGAYAGIVLYIKSKAINAKELKEIGERCDQIAKEIEDLKKQDLDQQEDIMKAEQLIDKLDRDVHDLVIFLLDRK